MTRILYGKPVADKIKAHMIEQINAFKSESIFPKIAIIRVGQRPDDIAYEERIIKNCNDLGIEVSTHRVDHNIFMDNLEKLMLDLNAADDIHGILMFRPLPPHLDADLICRTIDPTKDIDCMSPVNAQKIFIGDRSVIPPCTPLAVLEILKYYDYSLEGADVVIVNRSMVLGKPLGMLLLDENATVTICHSRTKDIKSLTSHADIIVTGAGKAGFFDSSYFSSHSVVIDAGINFKNGDICGDVEHGAVLDFVEAVSPVPGGVGTVTSTILLRNVLVAIELQKKSR